MMNGISNGTVATDDEKEKENNDNLQPSTSRAGAVDEPKWNIATRQLYEDNLKSTSTTPQKNVFQHHLPRERVPSVSESTSSDESCVYMYKGGNENRNGNELHKNPNCSSPEMDYLEMDFDPCQSNGHDSSDGSYSCENFDTFKDDNVNEVVENARDECASTSINVDEKYSSTSSWVEENNYESAEPAPSTSNHQAPNPVNEQCVLVSQNIVVESNSYADINECVEPLDEKPEISQKIVLTQHIAEVGGNSCCMSSILQALNTIDGMETAITEDVIKKILENNRLEADLTIVDYLHTVSKGGLTVCEMMTAIEKLFNGCITSRFFHTQPRRKINLSSWLLNWLKKDVVPILSMNFHLTENDCDKSVNTSWHFQVVRAVGQKGISLFSQHDCVSEDIILKLLSNPSEVLISKDEVITRWTPESDLTQLMTPPDHSWKKYNVLGQVVNAIREGITGKSEDEMKYIKIPSPHRTGILLLSRSDNPNQRELIEASDLPFSDFLRFKET